MCVCVDTGSVCRQERTVLPCGAHFSLVCYLSGFKGRSSRDGISCYIDKNI